MFPRLLLALTLLSLSGCFLFSSDKPESEQSEVGTSEEDSQTTPSEASEVKTTPGKATTSSEQELYSKGRDYFEAEMFTLAKDTFFSLRDSYPFGAYTLFAELKAADSAYMLHDYAEAGKLYEDFAKNHPTSNDASYAQLLAARSFVKTNKGIGRNRAPLEYALELLNIAIQQSKDSPYIKALESERAQVIKALEEHEQLIVDFYKKRDNQEAANTRSQKLTERFSKMAINSSNIENKGGDTLTPIKLSLSPLKANEINYVTDPNKIEGGKEESYGVKILSLSCEKGDPGFMTIELSHMTNALREVVDGIEFSARNDLISIDLPGLASETHDATCFEGKNLSISQTGTLTLASEGKLMGGVLLSPPRLLFIVEE